MVGNGPIMQFTFGVFLKPIMAEFHIDRGLGSLALTVGLTATALTLPFAGALTDRFGPRRVALGAVGLMGLALLGVALLAHSVWSFMALFAVMGIAAAGQTPLPYAKAITACFDRNRGAALAVALTGVGVGSVLLPLFAQRIVGAYGWRTGYAGIALVLLVVAVPALVLFIPGQMTPAANPEASAVDAPGLTLSEAFRSPAFWLLVTGLFFGAAAANGAIAHIVPLLTDHGVTAQRAVSAMAWVGLSAIIGRLLAGYLLDRFWAPLVALIFLAGMAAGMTLLAIHPTAESATKSVMLIGLGLGLEADLVGFLLSRYMGLRAFGTLFGFVFGAFILASSLGPVLMGTLFDLTGGYTICLLIFVGFTAVSATAFLSLGRYRYPHDSGRAVTPGL